MTIESDISVYYSEKVSKYGACPRGVDWNGVESQMIRFNQLSKLISANSDFSVNDLGCGYGAFLGYLNSNFESFHYFGLDISCEMIEKAKDIYGDKLNAEFYCISKPPQVANYSIASGIFNVKLGYSDSDWLNHIKQTLRVLYDSSSEGFAFNCLTKYSDRERMQNKLFYGDPSFFFDWCKNNFSRNVALLHDYDLYEFTIIVRK